MREATNPAWVAKAEALKPQLLERRAEPRRLVEAVADEAAFQGWRVVDCGSAETLPEQVWAQGDSFALDFGEPQVGYVTMRIRNIDSNADAPLRLKLIFGEMPCEIGEDFASYEGWLSRSWLQEEIVTIDVLPGEVWLPRRYTFRYMKIVVLSASIRYRIRFEELSCTSVSSADLAVVPPLPPQVPERLRQLDEIAVLTLRDCMQTVYEDGPKRDRRLWIGDLRLQALVGYVTVGGADLVKRCLYLFAGLQLDNGKIAASLYERPQPFADETELYDYALFFAAVLRDYYAATGDRETLTELWPVAIDQVRLALGRLDERDIVRDDETWYCFLDWHDELNKQAGAQAVLIYAMKQARELAVELGDASVLSELDEAIARTSAAALAHLWDEAAGLFVSGASRQVSWASQVWMVLAGVCDREQGAAILSRLRQTPGAIEMTTPYMVHHYIEALIGCGERDEALSAMLAYWGGMVDDGADRFWELYNPQDKRLSPYGSNLVNSYCHAWSCTPAYFIRTYYI